MNHEIDHWNDFVGNHRLKTALRKIIRLNRRGFYKKHPKPRLLITGSSRSGKTALVEFFARVVACQLPNDLTLDPCNRECDFCKERSEKFGIAGLFSDLWSGGNELISIDCGLVSSLDSMIEKLDVRNIHPDRTRIYFLDECQSLFRKKMDESLLKTVEQINAFWFFSTAKPDEIDAMFMNRLINFQTELPSKKELALWLQKRCHEYGLKLSAEEIVAICNKSNLVPGLALKQIQEFVLCQK